MAQNVHAFSLSATRMDGLTRAALHGRAAPRRRRQPPRCPRGPHPLHRRWPTTPTGCATCCLSVSRTSSRLTCLKLMRGEVSLARRASTWLVIQAWVDPDADGSRRDECLHVSKQLTPRDCTPAGVVPPPGQQPEPLQRQQGHHLRGRAPQRAGAARRLGRALLSVRAWQPQVGMVL